MYSPLSPIFLTVRIDVNIKTPEANHEALVFPLTDIKGVDSKKHFYGYYTMLPMDIWYILQSKGLFVQLCVGDYAIVA
jgi:hypothetical protein